jgi:hypothetical protein
MSNDAVTFSGDTKSRWCRLCPRCAPRFFPVGGFGGARFTEGGSDEGGFEEFDEFWLSLAFSSATSRSSFSIRCWSDSKTASSAA